MMRQIGSPSNWDSRVMFLSKKIIETTNNPRNLTASLPLKHDGWKLEDEFPFGSKPILRAMFNFRGVTTQYL